MISIVTSAMLECRTLTQSPPASLQRLQAERAESVHEPDRPAREHASLKSCITVQTS
jgi:hypothetical protein